MQVSSINKCLLEVLNRDEEKVAEDEDEELDFVTEEVETEVATEVDEVAENKLLALTALAALASDAVLVDESARRSSGATALVSTG